jgi:hypothetical protein
MVNKVAIEGIEESVREIATLFVALSPLDVVLGADRPHAFRNGLIFMLFGVILFVSAVFTERRRLRG